MPLVTTPLETFSNSLRSNRHRNRRRHNNRHHNKWFPLHLTDSGFGFPEPPAAFVKILQLSPYLDQTFLILIFDLRIFWIPDLHILTNDYRKGRNMGKFYDQKKIWGGEMSMSEK
ncbi:MAG TPA: hypothetical protein VN226_01565 [Anaerolineales bacterium]|nr:hypothetical protein [Anaerolineales bacterium]